MASPFGKISSKIQNKHCLVRNDVAQLAALSKNSDPRVIHYCTILRAHRRECPICSWPRLYPFIRKTKRVLRIIICRKVF